MTWYQQPMLFTEASLWPLGDMEQWSALVGECRTVVVPALGIQPIATCQQTQIMTLMLYLRMVT